MKVFIRVILMVAVLTLVFAGAVFAFAESDIKLQLDGQIIKTDVPPIIESDRTLVPYRALLEAMGAEVHWEKEAEMATAILGSHRVQVTIGRTDAFVNGAIKKMDVPPRIINDWTMIPLRFVLENLNCTVAWDGSTRTVIVESPQSEGPTEVSEIIYEETAQSYRIIARGSNIIKSTKTFSYNEPERYGIDIHNAILPEKVGAIAAENTVFNNIRFSQFDEDTVRIVVDLNDKVAGKLSLSEDRSTLYLDFDKPEADEGAGSEDEGARDLPDDPGQTDGESTGMLPELDWRASGRLIAIDVGHGGIDPGASGKINGVTVINEKDLNLDIALRLHQLLDDAGANVVLLRDKDIGMSLYERPEAANSLNADLLISIHNNATDKTSVPNGTEVLYYDSVGTENYGISSKLLAEYIQTELLIEIGLKDRGVKNSPQLAVLNKSLMPAVIIEGGFLSNPMDLQAMLTDRYKEAYAVGTARGIINALNYWAEGSEL